MSAPIHDDFEDRLKYAPPWARHAVPDGLEPPQDATARNLDEPAPARLPSAPSTVPRAYEREPDGPPESGFEGDIAIRRLRRRMSLDPQAVPEPPAAIRSRGAPRMIARLAGVMLVAAVVAFAVVMLAFPQGERSAPVPTRSASLAPEPTLPKSDRSPPPETVAPLQALAPPARPEAVEPSDPAPAPAAPAPPPSAEREAPSPPAPAARLDPEEIAVLLRRGQDYFANGDLASARLMFRRAAEAGDAKAALSLGATYDPNVLAKLHVLGSAPDVAQARTWYQRAVELGSAEASRRIEQLTDASR